MRRSSSLRSRPPSQRTGAASSGTSQRWSGVEPSGRGRGTSLPESEESKPRSLAEGRPHDPSLGSSRRLSVAPRGCTCRHGGSERRAPWPVRRKRPDLGAGPGAWAGQECPSEWWELSPAPDAGRAGQSGAAGVVLNSGHVPECLGISDQLPVRERIARVRVPSSLLPAAFWPTDSIGPA